MRAPRTTVSLTFWRHLPPFLLPLIFINLTGHIALSGGRLSGSLYVLGAGGAESLVGVFMALFSVIPLMASLAIGRWVDRAGAARVMRTGIVLVLAGAWLPVVFLSVPSMLVLAMILGLGFNMLSVAAQHTVGHLVSDATPAQRLANFGWYALGHSASSALGPFIAGLLIDHAGFRAAFGVLALCAGLAALLVFSGVRRLPRPQAAIVMQAQPHAPAIQVGRSADRRPAATSPRTLDLLVEPEMRRIYWVNMTTASAWDLFIVMLPVLGHRLGYSASVIGTVFSLFAVGTFVSRAAMPWLSRRANEWQILRVALVAMVLVFFVLPWAVVATMLMALGLVFGAAVGMSQPNMLSLLHSAAPPGRGAEAVGLRSVLSAGCSVVVPLAFGLMVGPLGLPAVLIGSGALFAGALAPAHAGVKARGG